LTAVFVESAAAMGGVQFSTLYLLQHLNKAVWDAVVVCPAEGDLSEACRLSGINLHILGLPRIWSTSFRIGPSAVRMPNPVAWLWNMGAMLVAARRLGRFLKQKEPHLVVTKGLFPHFYGGLAAYSLDIPCVWHVQDFISERFGKIYQRLFSQVARWLPDHLIVDGATIARQLHHSLHDRISIIHNGVDTSVFRPDINGEDVRREFGIPSNALVIGHVGRMTPWKGQHYLLQAFARIAAEVENVYLLLVGAPVFDSDAYQRDLVQRTSKLGLSNRVKFAGYRHDMPFVLAAMDVFAFSSVEKDTSPLALLSAMSSGLPIVAFDIEGVRELFPAGEQFLVPSGNVDELAQSITILLSDAEMRLRMGSLARKRAETDFDVDKFVSRVEQAFLKACHSPLSDQTPSEIQDQILQA
jgi:glycosyltransferase involved in cell wall biosynthesis